MNELKAKSIRVNDILEQTFGIPLFELEEDPLDCLIMTILSQNTNDINRDKAFESLKSNFPTWEDVLKADAKDLAEAIKVGGLANQKAETIKNFLSSLKKIRKDLSLDFIRDMTTEKAIEFLCQHKGIGVKTASVTLLFSFGRELFPVDTHILRISKRLGLVPPNCSAEEAHKIMGDLCPKGKEYPFHVNLITFGRRICQARNPKCHECPLYDECLYVTNPNP